MKSHGSESGENGQYLTKGAPPKVESHEALLIKEITVFILAKFSGCKELTAKSIARLAVRSYIEQKGEPVNETNYDAVIEEIIEKYLMCLCLNDHEHERLMRDFIQNQYSKDSAIYETTNTFLLLVMKSQVNRVKMNEDLIGNLAEYLWESIIEVFKRALDPLVELKGQRLHRVLIDKFLKPITAETRIGTRFKLGVAENLAINWIYLKAMNGLHESMAILERYLHDKLPPVYQRLLAEENQQAIRQYGKPGLQLNSVTEAAISQMIESLIQKVLGDIEARNCSYDPEIKKGYKKSLLLFVLKEYLSITIEDKAFKNYQSFEEVILGQEDQVIENYHEKDEFISGRNPKLLALVEVFRLTLRCGGFPHEQFAFLFLDFLKIKPEEMIGEQFHEEKYLMELREVFWAQIANRLIQWDFNNRGFLIYLNPLDQRLKLQVKRLTALTGRKDCKIAAEVLEKVIEKTKLIDYHNFSGRTINMAISLWRDNVRRTIDSISGVSVQELPKIIDSTEPDYDLDTGIRTNRNQCKLKDIEPCGGETGVGCVVFEVKKGGNPSRRSEAQ